MLNKLLNHGSDVNRPGANGESPLSAAIIAKSFTAAAVLIDKGANVNSLVLDDKVGPRPLQLAISVQSKEVVALLLHKGADTAGLDFGGAEMERFILENEWQADEFEPDKVLDRLPTERNEDVREFEFPEVPEVNVERRYTNQRYVKEVLERNRTLVQQRKGESDSDDIYDSDSD